MQPLIHTIDTYIIIFYRLTGHAAVNFVIGTFILACICVLVGEATLFLTFRVTRKQFAKKTAEAEKYHSLSIAALQAGDREAYEAANKLAKDAFGHTFFQQITLSAAFLWPVCFALTWMQYRFLDVAIPLPGTGWSLGFIGVFIILYVLAYFLSKRLVRMVRLRRFSSTTASQPPDPPQNPAEPLLATPPSLIHLSDKK